MRFYKRDPDRALAGMSELTLQQRGAYNTILDALYSRDGVLPDDDQMLRRIMGCHGNEWRAVKAQLIAVGKVWIQDGYIKAKGVDSTLKDAENFSETQQKRARKRWEIENKRDGKNKKDEQNQRAVDAKGENAINRDRESIESTTDVVDSPNLPKKSDDVDRAITAWNDMAQRAGLSKAQVSPNDARRPRIKARLKEADGINGWGMALDIIEASEFLTGGASDRDWRASLDWMSKKANFIKIMEGNYDNRGGSSNGHGAGQSRRNGSKRSSIAEAHARSVDSLRRHGVSTGNPVDDPRDAEPRSVGGIVIGHEGGDGPG